MYNIPVNCKRTEANRLSYLFVNPCIRGFAFNYEMENYKVIYILDRYIFFRKFSDQNKTFDFGFFTVQMTSSNEQAD